MYAAADGAQKVVMGGKRLGVAAAVALSSLVGCKTTFDVPVRQASRLDAPAAASVERSDGEEVELRDEFIVILPKSQGGMIFKSPVFARIDDSHLVIGSNEHPHPFRIPLSSVPTLEVKQYSQAKTIRALIIFVGAPVLALATVIIYCNAATCAMK